MRNAVIASLFPLLLAPQAFGANRAQHPNCLQYPKDIAYEDACIGYNGGGDLMVFIEIAGRWYEGLACYGKWHWSHDWYVEPYCKTCFNDVQDENETGIDCGGPCKLFYDKPCCLDNDGDGYSAEAGGCGPVDCNDEDPEIYPEALDQCDRKDNDCDGKVDGDCCDLEIGTFTAPETTLHVKSGGTVRFRAGIRDSSDRRIRWTLSVLDRRFEGYGRSVEQNWDGKKKDGKVVDPGTHFADLTARREGEESCSDSKTLRFTVADTPNPCRLKVTFGSSAGVASGELTDRLSLFTIPGAGPSVSLTLHYASLDGYDGPLGTGWSHSYDIFVTENTFGEVVLHEGDGGRKLYTPSGSGYLSQPGDTSTLSKNTDGTFVLARKDETQYHFTAQGKITSIIDRNGNALIFKYAGGLLAAVTDAAGRRIEFSYDGAGRLASVLDPAGNSYSFTVGKSLESVTFPNGGTWSYSYDDNAFLTARTDPEGHLTTYAYDGQHRVTRSVDPEGRTRTISYPPSDEAVRTTTVTEKDGGVWRYTYDTSAGDLLAKTDPQGNTTSYTYDASHNTLSRTDAAGTTAYTYDGAGNMTSVTDPLGQTTSYTYNEFGQVTSITDPEGSVTRYEVRRQGKPDQDH